MAMKERFGDYVLLKKLADDPLGETFRAGKAGPDGLEQVLLLKVFNGDNVDGATLWKRMRERAEIQKALKSPNIAEGTELGQVHGVPYVAYEYISGKDLASLLAAAERQGNPVPTDDALLIMERVALGLAVAYGNRLGPDRILHGFLVPHFVVISNEGETRLVGFEPAPALRGVAASSLARKEFSRYLSPEAVAGDPPHKADDIYSLGAILYELLTGQRIPAAPGDDVEALIDQARLAQEGTPLPRELASLLKQSLAPRDRRLGDVVTWHKSLSKLMFEGQHSPTTFNLAFFMHNLFRTEIERETEEIEIEKTLKLDTRKATAEIQAVVKQEESPTPASSEAQERTGTRETTATGTDAVLDRYGFREEKKSSRMGLILGLAAALLVAVGVTALLVLTDWRPGAAPGPDTDVVATLAPEPAPEPELVEPEGPTPEELTLQQQQTLEEQLRSLIEERTEAMGERYEVELRRLQRELEEARLAAERAAAERAALERRAEERAASPAAVEPEAEPRRPAPATEAARPTPVREPEPAARPPAPEPTPAAPAEEETVASVAPLEPEPEPARVQRGDLVTMGPDVVPPMLIRQPQPTYPPAALRLRREALVAVRVLVDEEGRVAETELASDRAGMGFDEAALRAAAAARFRPATKNGVPVKIWQTLNIQFQLGN